MKVVIAYDGREYRLLVADLEEQSEFWESWRDMTHKLSFVSESTPHTELAALQDQIDQVHDAAWKTVRDVEGLREGLDKTAWLAHPPWPIKTAFANNLAELVRGGIKPRLSEQEGNS